jgi:gluconolactonase
LNEAGDLAHLEEFLSPQGKQLGTIELPEIPANYAFGDADGRTLYITARTSLYRVKLATAGKQP